MLAEKSVVQKSAGGFGVFAVAGEFAHHAGSGRAGVIPSLPVGVMAFETRAGGTLEFVVIRS
jgi:hypothetical protein